jgi:methyl-accepting chemotaxis protein
MSTRGGKRYFSLLGWVRKSLNRKVALPLLLGYLVFALILVYVIYALQMRSVEHQALKQAESAVAQMVTTETILAERGLLARHLVHMISERFDDQGLLRFRLISLAPIDPERLPQSAWEKEALTALVEDPEGAKVKLEQQAGESWLLQMTPIRASSPACVSCHNSPGNTLDQSPETNPDQSISADCKSCHEEAHGAENGQARACIECHSPHRADPPAAAGGVTGAGGPDEGSAAGPAPAGEPSTPVALNDMLGALVVEVPLTGAFLQARNQAIGLSLGILAALTASVIGVVLLQHQLVIRPVVKLSRATRLLSEGNLAVELPRRSQDEIGSMAVEMANLTHHIQEMASVANRLAEGDLSVEVNPRSAEDVLGNASKRMVQNLRRLVRNVRSNASGLSAASEHLSAAAVQAGQATAQIAGSLQQIARGTAQQSESTNRTAASVEQTARAADGFAKGAQEQAAAVSAAAHRVAEINFAIQGIAAGAQEAAQASSQATSAARQGDQMIKKVNLTFVSIIDAIDNAAGKVNVLGAYSGQIGSIAGNHR